MSKRKLPPQGRRAPDDRGVSAGMDAALKAAGARKGAPTEADAPPLSTFPMTPAAKAALEMEPQPWPLSGRRGGCTGSKGARERN